MSKIDSIQENNNNEIDQNFGGIKLKELLKELERKDLAIKNLQEQLTKKNINNNNNKIIKNFSDQNLLNSINIKDNLLLEKDETIKNLKEEIKNTKNFFNDNNNKFNNDLLNLKNENNELKIKNKNME